MQYIRDCEHRNALDDYENGCTVCTDCGLVLHEQLFQCYNNINKSAITCEEREYFPKSQFQALMWEVFETHNLPITCFMHLITDFQETSSICDNVIAFACQTYYYLVNDVPRSKKEICTMFKITIKDFNLYEKRLFKSKSNIDTLQPSALLPRLTCLKLSYANQKFLGQKADSLYKKATSSPNVVMAYVLYTIGNDNKLFTHMPRKILSINYVSDLCKTSATSVRRLINKLK